MHMDPVCMCHTELINDSCLNWSNCLCCIGPLSFALAKFSSFERFQLFVSVLNGKYDRFSEASSVIKIQVPPLEAGRVFLGTEITAFNYCLLERTKI